MRALVDDLGGQAALRDVPRVRLRLGIRSKIAAVILICMVPVLVLAGVFYYNRNQERRAFVLRTQEDAARALATNVETFMTNAVHAERAAGAAVTSQPYPVTGIEQLFAAIRANDPTFLALALALPDGRIEAADPPPTDRRRASLTGHRAFDAVRRGAGWALGPPMRIGDRSVVELATGIADEHGRLVAVVDGQVDLERLRASLPAGFTRQTGAIIVDRSGEVVLDLWRPAQQGATVAGLPAVRAALAGRVGTVEGFRDPASGTREVGAAVPIPTLGWAALVLEPEASALQPVRAAATQEALWVLAYAGLGLVLAWVLGGELSAPIRQLAQGARAVGRGELGHRVPVRRTDELGELATAFNEMSARLQRYVSEMNALQSVSDAALSTVNMRELLPPLVHQIIAALRADGGTIWFVDETTGELAVPAEFDGGPPAEARRLRPGQRLAGRVAASGRALVASDPRALRALAPDLAPQGVCAAAGVPLRAGGKVIGVMQVFSRAPRAFEPREIRLLETFADRVALAVDNARAYERQQEIAGIIQASLVPTPTVRMRGLAVAGRYQPSREVGGDFYAILPLEGDRVGIAIADVSGKGIAAASLSARCRYLLEALAADGRAPDAVLARLNRTLTRDAAGELFVSLIYGVVDREAGTFRFSNAGHPAPLLLRGAGPAATLDAHGLLLGVDAGARYVSAEARIVPGDILVMFTDGITEARNAGGEQFGERRLAEVLEAARDAEPEEVAGRVMDAVAGWSARGRAEGPVDDQAFVAARVLP